MKHPAAILAFFICAFYCSAQTSTTYTSNFSKPPIDSAAIANWADLLWGEPSVTPDGKFFMYPIQNIPVGSSTLVLQATEGATWKKEIIGVERAVFSGDSKQAIYQKGDTLFFQPLGKANGSYVTGVVSYSQPSTDPGQWLGYQLRRDNELVIRNLYTGNEDHYISVIDYSLDKTGSVVMIKTKSSNLEQLRWINLLTNEISLVWQSDSSTASRYQFDEQGRQLVFLVKKKAADRQLNSIWYYKKGSAGAIEKVNDHTPGIDSGMIVGSSAPSLSKSGKYISFKIEPIPQPQPKPDPNDVQVDVWSYKDDLLQYTQLLDLRNIGTIYKVRNEFAATVSIIGDEIIRLENDNESVMSFVEENYGSIVVSKKQYSGDKSWLNETSTYFLVSLKNGKRSIITTGECSLFSFSPLGNYLVYYDNKLNNYFSYNVTTKIGYNASYAIGTKLKSADIDEVTLNNKTPVGMAGWLQDESFLIYDNYDLWKIDPACKKLPSNLSNGYGQKHNIKFRLMEDKDLNGNYFVHPNNSKIILTAFNPFYKQNGFFLVDALKGENPICLTMDQCQYYTTGNQANGLRNMKPVKATKSGIWILKRQTASDAPNYFITRNFKSFKQLTNIQPQKNYNWLTTELITWQNLDGKDCQGILYKPEDFNEKTKYPVIITYYEKKSQNLFQFIRPDYTGNSINIPWFVSRGYLVFTPDIHYTIGKTGESVINSIFSGTNCLTKLPFVDSTKLGICGHSFGGYETNFLVTHTTKFAAAAEAAGSSDWISHYGSLRPTLIPQASSNFEYGGQYRIESKIWGNIKPYILNSPIFSADQVTTPLLIMHNKKDETVPWAQAVELFIALRRLNKKVWMLQYDKGTHGLGKREAMDYTVRLTQFFNHYLKQSLPPKWMTEVISAN